MPTPDTIPHTTYLKQIPLTSKGQTPEFVKAFLSFLKLTSTVKTVEKHALNLPHFDVDERHKSHQALMKVFKRLNDKQAPTIAAILVGMGRFALAEILFSQFPDENIPSQPSVVKSLGWWTFHQNQPSSIGGLGLDFAKKHNVLIPVVTAHSLSHPSRKPWNFGLHLLNELPNHKNGLDFLASAASHTFSFDDLPKWRDLKNDGMTDTEHLDMITAMLHLAQWHCEKAKDEPVAMNFFVKDWHIEIGLLAGMSRKSFLSHPECINSTSPHLSRLKNAHGWAGFHKRLKDVPHEVRLFFVDLVYQSQSHWGNNAPPRDQNQEFCKLFGIS